MGKQFDYYGIHSDEKITAIDILGYIYATLYSNKYRQKYKNQLKIDFPRIPYPDDYDHFIELRNIGWQLIELHLMNEPVDITPIGVSIGDSRIVEAPKYKNGEIKINKSGTKITNVPKDIWEMGIGGYAPLQKWLKDRRGLVLSKADINHYCEMVIRLKKTQILMERIDEIGIISE